MPIDPDVVRQPSRSGGWFVELGVVEAKGLEPSDLLTASQALYQLSYAPKVTIHVTRPFAPILHASLVGTDRS